MSAAAILADLAPDVPIPPELPVAYIDAYIAQVRRLVADGGDAMSIAHEYSAMVRRFREAGIDPFDPSLDEPVDVPLQDLVRWLETGEGDPCAK
jgi:hypothetical protein